MKRTKTINEECFVLLGGIFGRFWWGRKSKYSVGEPASVNFDANFVLKREETHGDVSAFWHTHPTFVAHPSITDHITMWDTVFSFGKPMVCVIKGTDGLRAWWYKDSDSFPTECVVFNIGSFFFGFKS